MENTDDGHLISMLVKACELLVSTMNATGGLEKRERSGALAPVGDTEWVDLADAAVEADRALESYYGMGNPPVLNVSEQERLIIHYLE